MLEADVGCSLKTGELYKKVTVSRLPRNLEKKKKISMHIFNTGLFHKKKFSTSFDIPSFASKWKCKVAPSSGHFPYATATPFSLLALLCLL